MAGKALHVRHGADVVERVEHLSDQVAASDSDAMRRHQAGRVPVAHPERLVQDPRDPCGEPRPRMVASQEPTASQKVTDATLTERVDELAVRGPAVAREAAGEIRPEDRRRLVEAAAGADSIDRGQGRGKHPEPVQRAADLPAGVVGDDRGTRAHRLTQRVRGRLALGRDPMPRADDGAGRHLQADAGAEQRRGRAERHAELCVELHGQRDGVRTELDGRRAERIRRLERMAALHAMAAAAPPDMHVKTPDDPLHRREVFLILRRDLVSVTTASPQVGHDAGTGTSCVSCTTGGIGRRPRRPERAPALRPGRRGRRVGVPFENGAACRAPARRAASHSSFRRAFSRSSRARSRSTHHRAASDRTSASRNCAISRRCCSISSPRSGSRAPRTRPLCQNSR